MQWRNGLSALIGVWFILAPWILGFSDRTAAVWTSVIIGAVQAIASIWIAVQREAAHGWKTWQNWVSCLTGVWFILQPFVLSLSGLAGETWTSVILGIVTAALNLWEMSAEESTAGSSSGGSRAAAS
ncbi:hypothetical protein GCM10010885_14400 [Alicyclobacillus cellulosilyticus]|uniref:SPW repeat-containing integral membrane domain-containing protein n=1 Tax=Alicyclobacillus cellulosilyticus TaxID=1003997 RepID=A0A917NJY9_9BACL|nr:SPW repeat protein [Alicyclobacillus cellulosilyticus]GGJ06362.1 hypothetical protein GCM10010885_14400 [Alicyclobacillus cellulosilyticus]